MTIEEQFNKIASEYDRNRRKFIPCFDDFYGGAVDFLAAGTDKPKCIADLGAGTGLLASYWYLHFPDSRYILTDIAEDMLDIARKRFADCKNVSFEVGDYTKALPNAETDVIISALSIHHLTDDDKMTLFEQIYKRLPKGGLFANHDQFCGESSVSAAVFDSYWEGQLYRSGLTENDIALWKERRKLDKECSAEKELEMLRSCGFESVSLIYSNIKFSVVAAVK